MQNKTQLVYRISKVTPMGELKYRSLCIVIFATEAPGDEICFYWDRDSGKLPTTITAVCINVSLAKLLLKMSKANISSQSPPEDVIQFLENNKISQAVEIGRKLLGAKEQLSFHITEEEIQAGKFKRGGKNYEFPAYAKKGLLEELQHQRNIKS